MNLSLFLNEDHQFSFKSKDQNDVHLFHSLGKTVPNLISQSEEAPGQLSI